MGKQAEDVLREAETKNVKFIRLWFTDILGTLKSFSITVEELEDALTHGKWFDGSSIEGFARIFESDLIACPDPDTFRVLPWRTTESSAVARMFCDIKTSTGDPYPGDPRWVLKENLERAGRLGYAYYVGPELEYFYFQNSDPTHKPQILDEGGYFDLTPLDAANDMRRDTVLVLDEMGIPVECSHHEVAPSQHEIDLRYAEALAMADRAMTYRLVVKEVALKYNAYATFMPKPLMGQNGSGMHVHQSLFKGGKNAFYDPKDKYRLSPVAKHFIAGLLRHSREISAVVSQWVNSYKRLVPGYEAPVYISWARQNRSALVRVPAYRPGKESSTRCEYRAPDPACNPYLAFSVMLAAGLAGVEGKYELPEPVEEDIFEMSEEERVTKGIHTLPGNLFEATQLMEKSELVRAALGDHVFEKFLENKRIEWDNYRTYVTDYELKKYLPIL
jgi:glutamine synthetase